ncbi:aminoglycoside nucleotidyltransferase [Quadrisphaera sp. RL12-1S]|nr:aminoglycoside nucleotidyltransferase [Quadrisphaera sp. RL12-1S]MBC3764131.1 aminoglycoside nucleotidyltransferase [Quadrisphaera sp. RL12-1S]
MSADEVVRVLDALDAHGAPVVVGGGWGVDALVGHQTREHSDLDLWLSAEAFEPFVVAVGELGIDRLSAWPGDRPWNFVVGDGGLLRLDLHLVEPVDDVDLHHGSAIGGVRFPRAALEGSGSVGGRVVRCESLAWSQRWHQGYPPRDVDRHDVTRLCDLAGLPVPHGYELDG